MLSAVHVEVDLLLGLGQSHYYGLKITEVLDGRLTTAG